MNDPEQFFELYKAAARDKNKALMTGLYHLDAELFDMWQAYHLHGLSNITDMVNHWFDSLGDEQLEVEFSSIDLKQDGEIAFAYAFVHYRALDNTGTILRQMKNRMTVCFVKNNKAWSVLHQHTSIPISTMDLKGIFE